MSATSALPTELCELCRQTGRHVFYCSRECQTKDYPEHKKTCGNPPPPAFVPTPLLIAHINALLEFAEARKDSPPPAYLYFPPPTSTTNPSSPPEPVPIFLTDASKPLFDILYHTASSTGNQLSVNLMFSLLLEEVEKKGGQEKDLIIQLSDEFGFDLAKALDEEVDPEEEDLAAAVGGEENFGVLCKPLWNLDGIVVDDEAFEKR
ncbi:zinc finger, MYND-type protein [Pseudohyphozyma bogoriensis]|nr:zinc finger, MYND-type protein [Pseudohyphozyma bogoriensis]